MPTAIRTVVLDPDEVRTVERAESLLDIGFPLAEDPLVRRSREARARAVDATDPRRRVLRGLCSPYDLISYPRLVLSREVLTGLLAQVLVESDADYWLSTTTDPTAPQAVQMAEVLAAERTGQQRLVREALDLVTDALALLVPDDDPALLREAWYEV